MDEPCASLDHKSTRQVMNIIRQLPQQLIMATHHLELLEGFDRVIWLEKGKIWADGEPRKVIAEYRSAMEF
jgi:biotin transport system ATP-binding protein